MNEESQALLSVAGRQDAGSIEQAQIKARKSLRAEATAERERLRIELKRVTRDLAIAIAKSDSDVIARFNEDRVAQLNNGIIGIAIAQKDVQP